MSPARRETSGAFRLDLTRQLLARLGFENVDHTADGYQPFHRRARRVAILGPVRGLVLLRSWRRRPTSKCPTVLHKGNSDFRASLPAQLRSVRHSRAFNDKFKLAWNEIYVTEAQSRPAGR
jgi:hypothetical protein